MEATYETVENYLMDEYDLTKGEAKRLLEKHNDILQYGIKVGSYPYYIAKEIMEKDMKND